MAITDASTGMEYNYKTDFSILEAAGSKGGGSDIKTLLPQPRHGRKRNSDIFALKNAELSIIPSS